MLFRSLNKYGNPGTGRIRRKSPIFPSIGTHYAQVLLLLILPGVLVYSYAWGYDDGSVGLPVHLLRTESLGKPVGSCAEAWAVRIDSEEIWYLNSKKIYPDELASLLREQQGTRTNCTVFLDVDTEVPYSVAIRAIDLMQETPAKVVLLTPETKKIHAR